MQEEGHLAQISHEKSDTRSPEDLSELPGGERIFDKDVLCSDGIHG
jgi:hypothetical protein